MYKIQNTNYIHFKYLFFLIFIFPFIMHIYWGVFDIFYANNIMYISLILLFGIIVINLYESKINEINDKRLLLSICFFLFIFLINSFLLNDYKDFIKYVFYFIIFYFLLSKYLANNYFIFYINIVTTFVFINLVLYVYCFIFPLQSFFIAEKLSLLTMDNSFLTRNDWEYSIPFYLVVFPINSLGEEQVGLLNLPRLFGMSTEPSLYSVVILPTIIMSLFFKKYIQSSILFFALLLSSSFGAILIGFIGFIFYVFYRFKVYIFIFLILLFFSAYYFDIYKLLSTLSPRLEFYMGLIMNIFDLSSINFFANNNFLDVEKLELPSAFLSHTLKYGLFQGVSYLIIFFVFINLSLKMENKLLFVFTIVSLLIINKSGEIISPLFLFFLSFIYSQYINFNRSNKQ